MYCIAKNLNPIKRIVEDLLIVEVANDALKENFFEYVILNNQSKAIRKGNFTGPVVQFCTRLFSQGVYKLEVKNCDINQVETIVFEKA